jgi:hypothetical protein
VRILFDQGTPVPLRRHLAAHQVSTTFERKWITLKNGELLEPAELSGFEILVTTDQNLKYQQNVTTRQIAIVVLSTTRCPRIEKGAASVSRAIDDAKPGSYTEVAIP